VIVVGAGLSGLATAGVVAIFLAQELVPTNRSIEHTGAAA
jgi:hypothetical protein